jgi:hypothetical protein
MMLGWPWSKPCSDVPGEAGSAAMMTVPAPGWRPGVQGPGKVRGCLNRQVKIGLA